ASRNMFAGQFDVIFLKPAPDIDQPGYVWRLNKSLYGLRHSPRNWFLHLRSVLINLGFIQSEHDQALFINNDSNVYLLIYVDSMLAIAPDEEIVKLLYEELNTKFQMKYMGPVHNFLGWQIERNDGY